VQLSRLGQDSTTSITDASAGTTTTFDSGSTDTSGGTLTSWVDSSGNPLPSSAVSAVIPVDAAPADNSAMNTVVSTAVSQNTDFLGNINLSGIVTSLANGYATVQKAINAGQLPYGTANHPTIGTVTNLPGGARSVVNADGSTTITDAAGNKQTIMPGGQVVSGGAPIFAGIPNSTLLIAGIGVAGILVRLAGR
jgi:hypothetical protein